MEITKKNIKGYAEKYDDRYKDSDDERTEIEMKNWLKINRFWIENVL